MNGNEPAFRPRNLAIRFQSENGTWFYANDGDEDYGWILNQPNVQTFEDDKWIDVWMD